MKNRLTNRLKIAIVAGLSFVLFGAGNVCSDKIQSLGVREKNQYKIVLPSKAKLAPRLTQSDKFSHDISFDYSKLTPEQAIKFIQTPQQAEDYNNFHFSFDIRNTENNSFNENHRDRKGNSLDYATNIAALLSDNNYPPYVLFMRGEKDSNAVFLYKTKEGFAIKDTTLGLFGSSHNTIEDVLGAYNSFHGKDYDSYFIADLDKTFPNREWIFGDKYFNPLFKDLDIQQWGELKKQNNLRKNYNNSFSRNKLPKFPGRILTKLEIEEFNK